jgi:hypothetical protein
VRRVALLALLLVGCGDAVQVEPASPQLVRVAWRESDGALDYAVRSIEITDRGWRVEASVTNRGSRALDVLYPHRAAHTRFGLIVSMRRELPRTRWLRDLPPRFYEQDERPPVPTTLHPGESWSGAFSGPGRPPRGAYVRVTFGRFAPSGRPADGFALVTRHVVRLAR